MPSKLRFTTALSLLPLLVSWAAAATKQQPISTPAAAEVIAPAPVIVPSPVESENSVHVKIGGAGGRAEIELPLPGHRGTGHPPVVLETPKPYERAWYCRVDAFDKSFRGFGLTELETRREVQARCAQSNNEIFCKKVDCQANTTVRPVNEKAWFCSVEAFGKTFESFGGTRLEAQDGALGQCLDADNNPMHCKRIECKANR